MNRRHLTAATSTALIAAALSSATTPAQAAPQSCLGHEATIVSHAELVIGTSGDDVIVADRDFADVRAGDGDDAVCVSELATVRGGDGDDTVTSINPDDMVTAYGDDGNDRLLMPGSSSYYYGGQGNDVLGAKEPASLTYMWPGRGNDVIRARAPKDGDMSGPTVTYSSSRAAVHVDLPHGRITGAGVGTDTIIGGILSVKTGSGDDTVQGYRHRGVWVATGPGDDTIVTGSGKDEVEDGAGSDVVSTGGGNDFAEHTSPSSSPDVVRLGAGRDILEGYSYGRFFLGAGNDYSATYQVHRMTIDAGPGVDLHEFATAYGDPVRQRITWDMRSGVISGRPATLTHFEDVKFWDATGHVTGTPGPNHMDFGNGRDVARGLGGNDVITGGHSDDVLDGGAGHDTLTGLGGTDTCHRGEIVRTCER